MALNYHYWTIIKSCVLLLQNIWLKKISFSLFIIISAFLNTVICHKKKPNWFKRSIIFVSKDVNQLIHSIFHLIPTGNIRSWKDDLSVMHNLIYLLLKCGLNLFAQNLLLIFSMYKIFFFNWNWHWWSHMSIFTNNKNSIFQGLTLINQEWFNYGHIKLKNITLKL